MQDNQQTAYDFLYTAQEIAVEVGEIIKQNLCLDLEHTQKADHTPVTHVDKMVNQIVIQKLKTLFPGHSILGEEQSLTIRGSEYTWICDPVDGTIGFAAGFPTAVFSLGLLKAGKPICGVIFDPFTERMFHTENGKSSCLNGKPISVGEVKSLDGARIGIIPWKHSQFDSGPTLQKLEDHNAYPVNITSYCNMAALVAAGSLQAAIYLDNKLHDIYPAGLLVEQAGGIATDLKGNIQNYSQPIVGQVVSNKYLHPQLLDIITI